MRKFWFDEAWEDYLYWQKTDKQTLKKINELIKDSERKGYGGKGHPEPLKEEYSGWWSKHIDEKNRFVYRIKEGVLEILSCRGHYDDK